MKKNRIFLSIGFASVALAVAGNIVAAPPMPPGYFDPPGVIPNDPTIWDPGVGRCDVVYVPGLSMNVSYHILGVRNLVPNDLNHFFYFPEADRQVLTFIDPRIERLYKKSVLDPKRGMHVIFDYKGGFPPGYKLLGGDNILSGNLSHIPGDDSSLELRSNWPFIKRSNVTYDIPKYCASSRSCYCIR
jgi:hypothetical protein